MKHELPMADGQRPLEPAGPVVVPRSRVHRLCGFTLIELLTVIAVIAVLAAFSVPVLSSVKRRQYLSHARAELTQLETAIQRYHDTLGFYPPDNAQTAAYLPSALTNQLYYELTGMTNTSPGVFNTLDGSQQNVNPAVFGVGGFDNCSRAGAGEDTPVGRNFLSELRPGQTGSITVGGNPVTLLTTGVGGPDASYNPLGQAAPPYLNPWRYKSSGMLTNNPGSYELWVQLRISGKKYLVCNWSDQAQINSPLP